jgi:hypothetical protein
MIMYFKWCILWSGPKYTYYHLHFHHYYGCESALEIKTSHKTLALPHSYLLMSCWRWFVTINVKQVKQHFFPRWQRKTQIPLLLTKVATYKKKRYSEHIQIIRPDCIYMIQLLLLIIVPWLLCVSQSVGLSLY